MNFIDKHIHGDRKVWAVVMILAIFSFLAVYSSTGSLAYAKANGNVGSLILRHAMMLMLGFACMIGVSKIRPHFLMRSANSLLVGSVGALGLALIMGQNINGASRWLNLGLFSFQPSEIAKFALVIFVARQLAKHQYVDKDSRKAFIPILIASGVVILPIFLENLSTAVLLWFTIMGLMVIGRIPGWWVLLINLAAVVFFIILIEIAPHVPLLKRASTWKARIERFWNPQEDANDAGNFQSNQAKNAVASGGVMGRGPGNSYYRNFLPMAFSDFIFAIILEEYGMFGGIILVFCYVVLMSRALSIARRCDRAFPIFLVLGITLLLVMQAAINMGVSVGLLPVTGQTLPMVSMGGTSNVITGGVIGIILSVSQYADSLGAKSKATAVENTEEVTEINS